MKSFSFESSIMNLELTSLEAVKEFIAITNRFDCDLALLLDRYVVDAKSIMGVLSVDLSRVVQLRIPSNDFNLVYPALMKFEAVA